MSNRIDQLFKEKLSDHKVAPSAEAWMKVQSGLVKKNKLVIVWRMAAVLVLFGALIGTWYFVSTDDTIAPHQLAKKKEIFSPEKEAIKKPVESVVESTKPNLAQTPKSEKKKKRTPDNEIKKETQNANTENVVTADNEIQKQVEEVMVLTEPILTTQASTQDKPIVIEFTLESTSTNPKIEVAQTMEEENSGLKKIIKTARDLKNGDSDLSVIRDAKNQLLALDFTKDKSKRN